MSTKPKLTTLDPTNLKKIHICINFLNLTIDIINISFGTSSKILESF